MAVLLQDAMSLRSRKTDKHAQLIVRMHLYEPVCEKTNNLGFRTGQTRNGLYNRRWLESRGIVLLQKVVFPWSSEHCHGNMCNLNVIVVLEFISRDLYLLFVILLSSKFQNSIFYQHMRPKSGLKFPRPLSIYEFHVA